MKAGEESNYMSLVIVLGTGILLSIALLLMVLLIRTPSVCKEIGKFFHREDRRAELDHLFMAAPIETRNPTDEPTLQGRIVAAGHNVQQYHVVAESEHLLQNAPTVGQGGGPYLQETEHTSPSTGPCPPSTQDVSSEENDTTENFKTTKAGSANSDGMHFSAGTNSGVQIQANTVTYNGNIYIYQVPAVPLVATGGSDPPAQVIPDPDDIPIAISEQGTFSFVSSSMEEVPLPFCRGPATGWQCITPQQEEGKDMHLTTEERLMDSMCSVELDGALYVDNGQAEFGQYK